jgi:excisionase family DNA binding protein
MGPADRPPAGEQAPPLLPALGRSIAIDQAARLLGVSRRTIYNRIRSGHVRTIRTRGGSQRVIVDSLYGLSFRARPASPAFAAFRRLRRASI